MKGELRDTALRVYLLLVSEGRSMSIREVQKALSLSSPGVAYHHLERLTRLGLAVKEDGGYRAIHRGGLIEGLLIIGSRILPRSTFYLGFSSAMLVAYIIVTMIRLIPLDPMAIIAMAALLVFSIMEFWDQWSRLRSIINRAKNYRSS
jgi:DNA-binding transcriptional ArsR family regulator